MIPERIKVFRWEKTCDAVHLVCYQCEDAPCIKVCGVAGAIARHKDTRAVMIHPDLCKDRLLIQVQLPQLFRSRFACMLSPLKPT